MQMHDAGDDATESLIAAADTFIAAAAEVANRHPQPDKNAEIRDLSATAVQGLMIALGRRFAGHYGATAAVSGGIGLGVGTVIGGSPTVEGAAFLHNAAVRALTAAVEAMQPFAGPTANERPV